MEYQYNGGIRPAYALNAQNKFNNLMNSKKKKEKKKVCTSLCVFAESKSKSVTQ